MYMCRSRSARWLGAEPRPPCPSTNSPDAIFKGTVTRYANSLDLATRTMMTEIDIDNRSHRLYPRMYAHVTLDLVRHPDAIRLPVGALGGSGADSFVLAVKDGRLVKAPVATGINDGPRYVEITSGLSGNELVVANLNPALTDGGDGRISTRGRALKDRHPPMRWPKTKFWDGKRINGQLPCNSTWVCFGARRLRDADFTESATVSSGRADSEPIAPGSQLSLKRAIAIALEFHPRRQEAIAERGAARERIGEARTYMLPQATALS